MGGEKVALQAALNGLIGSPPRGRGKVTLTYYYRQLERITPAWAGKSNLLGQSPWKSEDHPRVGGEKHQDESSVMELQGSPPRGRGKGPHHKYCHPFHRITPAWAGKRSSHPSGSSMAWDHPRVGGEKEKKGVKQCGMTGSPPRGRGKDPSRCPPLRPVWITPAWAGKSRKCTPSQPAGQDHPRVGGEKPGAL